MDTNSKHHRMQLCLRLVHQFCVLFLKQAWPLVHTYPLYHRKRALWSGIQLHWSICWRDNLQRRMPFFLLTVENDLTFNDFVLYNQTCDNLAADTTKAWEAGFLNGMDYRIRSRKVWNCHLFWLPEFLMRCLLSWPWNSCKTCICMGIWAFFIKST